MVNKKFGTKRTRYTRGDLRAVPTRTRLNARPETGTGWQGGCGCSSPCGSPARLREPGGMTAHLEGMPRATPDPPQLPQLCPAHRNTTDTNTFNRRLCPGRHERPFRKIARFGLPPAPPSPGPGPLQSRRASGRGARGLLQQGRGAGH